MCVRCYATIPLGRATVATAAAARQSKCVDSGLTCSQTEIRSKSVDCMWQKAGDARVNTNCYKLFP